MHLSSKNFKLYNQKYAKTFYEYLVIGHRVPREVSTLNISNIYKVQIFDTRIYVEITWYI